MSNETKWKEDVMPVTTVRITNEGSKDQKIAVFVHNASLGEIRDRISTLLAQAFVQRYPDKPPATISFDDLWADIEEGLADISDRYRQHLDIGTLLAMPLVAERIARHYVEKGRSTGGT